MDGAGGFDPDIYVDSAMRRSLMRMPQSARDYYMRQLPEQLAIMPEYRPRSEFGGLDAITYGAIQWITQPLLAMPPQQRLTVYQQNPLLARHFPDLDPRNRRPQNLGPMVPLDRSLLIRYISSWPQDEIRRQFHLAPWLRHQFPEFAPPGGWPPRLFLPHRTFREFGEDIYNVQGPAELYEDWPIQDPGVDDPEPFNYVDSAHRPLSPRRNHDFQVRSRTPSPTINERRFRRAPPTTSWQDLQSYRQVGTSISADRYYDPARYRRGDPMHGYIAGRPEPPIYHDFDPRGHPLEDEHYVSRRLLGAPVVDPANSRDAVDYNRPQTRNYPPREPFDMVWDDNFTPAEHRHGYSPPRR